MSEALHLLHHSVFRWLVLKIRVHVQALSSTDFFNVVILMHPCEVAGPLIKVTMNVLEQQTRT